MRCFTYNGDHDSVTLWDITFPQGVAVAVEDPHALKKLEGNNHFTEVRDGFEITGDVIDGAISTVSDECAQATDCAQFSEPAQQPKRRGRPPKAK